MLRFYKPEWQAVLKDAKNLYRFSLATEDAYPSSARGYHEASESIQEAIVDFKRQGGTLEGESFIFTTTILSSAYR
jgi:hypothetical protein